MCGASLCYFGQWSFNRLLQIAISDQNG